VKIWRFSEPRNFSFACAGRRGTWEENPDTLLPRVKPLIIEWKPGSNIMGNFIWPGFDSDIAVVETVGFELKKNLTVFNWGPLK
jgi:hypothetical protein